MPEDEEEVTLEEERLGLAQNLTATILEMTGAELDDAWRHETPSRVHASDREAAERFKAYEDEGSVPNRSFLRLFGFAPLLNSRSQKGRPFISGPKQPEAMSFANS